MKHMLEKQLPLNALLCVDFDVASSFFGLFFYLANLLTDEKIVISGNALQMASVT